MAEAFQETDLESDSRSETSAATLSDSEREDAVHGPEHEAEEGASLERSRWEVQDGDDEEVTMMVRKMKYEEVPGRGIGVFYHTPSDDHLYRKNRAKNGQQYVACYHSRLTNDRDVNVVKDKCTGFAVLDPQTKEIKITSPHNHPPDLNLLKRLKIRDTILKAAANSTASLSQVFHDSTRGAPGAELVGLPSIRGRMHRKRRENLPPPPGNAEEAHEFLTSIRYNGQNFAKHYKGIVRGSEDNERALTFAHEGNLSKLGPDTKVFWADGTFRTAPALRDNTHMYQLLRVYGDYKGKVFPIFQAIMSGKSRQLYDVVYARLRDVLPESVNPEMIMTDYEIALQGGLSQIFPNAEVVGCWFHYSQNVFKKLANVGLKNAFIENDIFKIWIKLVMALPLLPKEHIVPTWNELKHQPIPRLLSSQPLRKLKSYIQKTWIDQRIEVLSVYGCTYRTNNSAESSNAQWNAKVGVKHPNFWHLLNVMHDEFEDTCLQMSCLDNNVKITRRQRIKNVLNTQRLRAAEDKLLRGVYTPMEFLRTASYSFAKTATKYFIQLQESLDDDPELGGEILSENEGDEDIQANDEQPQDDPQDQTPTQPQDLNDDNLCIICFANQKNAVMVPCGHGRFCFDCGNECIRTFTGPDPTCPLCRAPIAQCIQII